MNSLTGRAQSFSGKLFFLEEESVKILEKLSKATSIDDVQICEQRFDQLITESDELFGWANENHVPIVDYLEQYHAFKDNVSKIQKILADPDQYIFTSPREQDGFTPARPAKMPKTYSTLEQLVRAALGNLRFDEARSGRADFAQSATNRVFSAFESNPNLRRSYNELKRSYSDQGELFRDIELWVYKITGLVSPETRSLYG